MHWGRKELQETAIWDSLDFPYWTVFRVLCRQQRRTRSGFSPAAAAGGGGGGGGEASGIVSALKSSESNPGPRPNPKITLWKRLFFLVTRTWHHSKQEGQTKPRGEGNQQTHIESWPKKDSYHVFQYESCFRNKREPSPPSRTLLDPQPSWENHARGLRENIFFQALNFYF